MLRSTALTARHEAAGAKLVDFAGWSMPLEFTGVIDEHTAVRTDVGVFDVSHLGTVFVTGPDAALVLAASITKDPHPVQVGRSQYTLCATPEGGVLDDLIVYHLQDDHWMVVPNASNTEAVVAVLAASAVGRDAVVNDESPGWAILAVQGPNSLETLSRALEAVGADADDPASISWLSVRPLLLDGLTGVICRTGYTGEEGCELVVPNAIAESLWDALLHAGARPIGLGARDTLRLEMGYPLHGNDLDPTVSPYEARLAWAVTLDRDEFQGQAALAAAKEAGATRRLWGLRGDTRRPLRAGQEVLKNGAVVGALTSGGYSPTLEVGIGMGFLAIDSVTEGDVVDVDVRGRTLAVTVVKPPFVDRSPGG